MTCPNLPKKSPRVNARCRANPNRLKTQPTPTCFFTPLRENVWPFPDPEIDDDLTRVLRIILLEQLDQQYLPCVALHFHPRAVHSIVAVAPCSSRNHPQLGRRRFENVTLLPCPTRWHLVTGWFSYGCRGRRCWSRGRERRCWSGVAAASVLVSGVAAASVLVSGAAGASVSRGGRGVGIGLGGGGGVVRQSRLQHRLWRFLGVGRDEHLFCYRACLLTSAFLTASSRCAQPALCNHGARYGTRFGT